jgi:hypothetical protein
LTSTSSLLFTGYPKDFSQKLSSSQPSHRD